MLKYSRNFFSPDQISGTFIRREKLVSGQGVRAEEGGCKGEIARRRSKKARKGSAAGYKRSEVRRLLWLSRVAEDTLKGEGDVIDLRASRGGSGERHQASRCLFSSRTVLASSLPPRCASPTPSTFLDLPRSPSSHLCVAWKRMLMDNSYCLAKIYFSSVMLPIR